MLASRHGTGQSGFVPDISALVGSAVTRVTLDEYQLTLLFVDAAPERNVRVSAHLVIEKAFMFETGGEVFEIDPQRCQTFGPTWRFLSRTVARAEATDDLIVDIWFDDQSHFTLRPGGPYEAFHMWTASGGRWSRSTPKVSPGPSA